MSKLINFILKLYTKNPMVFALVCLLLLTIPVGMFFGDNVHKLKKFDTANVQENKALVLHKITPEGIVSEPKEIVFTFSDPVDAHMLEHNLTISPETPGTIRQGNHPNKLIFVPQTQLAPGMMYSIKIARELTSKNGKMLFIDWYHNFSIEFISESIAPMPSAAPVHTLIPRVYFSKDDVVGKVLSFPAGKPVSFTTHVSDTDQANIKVYKSDQAHLLNYLVYRIEKKTQKESSWSEENFLRETVEHSNTALIDTLPVVDKKEVQLSLQPGIYYVEADGEVKGNAFFIVNSVGVTFRQDDKKIVLSTFDIHTGKRVSYPSTLGLYNLENAPRQLETLTYNEIESSVPFSFYKRLDAIVGTINGESIFIPVQLPKSFADIQVTQDLDQAKEIFLYTDRPLYKPKDKVFFKGIVRVDGDALYRVPPAGLPLRIYLGWEDNPEIDLRVQTDAEGNFSGSFVLPESLTGEGDYTTEWLYASPVGQSDYYDKGYAYFDVVKYTKPDFEIRTTVNNVEMLRSDKAQFTISANTFTGSPLKNQDITYEIYEDKYYETERSVYNKNFNIIAEGGMCGGGSLEEYYGSQIGDAKNIRLDEYGRAEVNFILPESNTGSKKLTLVAKKKDKNGNEIVSAVNTVVHGATFNIFFMPSANTYAVKEELVAPFYAETLAGEKLGNKEFTYRFIETSYDTFTYKTVEKTVTSGTVITDDSGRGIITFQLPSNTTNGSKYLVVEAKDDKGNITDARKYISLTAENENQAKYAYWERNNVDQTYLNITSSKNNFQVNDIIKLNVKAPKDLDVLLTLERGRIYYPRLVSLNKGDNTVDITVGEDLSPSITVMFTFFADGEYHTEGVSLNVPAMHKLLQVTVSSDKAKYKPDETALVKITTKDSQNSPVPAQLSLSVVDKALLTLRKNTAPPIHSSFYYFRSRTTNASSSLTWVGEFGGGGGGGGGGGMPLGGQAVDTLYWNPSIKTGTNGETVVPVPLEGFSTTWNALVIGSTMDALFGQGDTEFISAD